MELILKPTAKCNFACTFCSAKNLDIWHMTYIPDNFKIFLKTHNPSSIIITGGDPLTLDPKIYFELLELGTWKISFTTNLKDFDMFPAKWIELFKNPRIGVCTSFQYGSNRLYDQSTIYSEQMFIDIMNKFNLAIGYTPGFIAVIDDTNEKYALKHLELARSLNTKCKINRMMPLGQAYIQYPLYKLINIYLEAYDKKLNDYLDIQTALFNGGCGFNINGMCQSTIRSMMFDENKNIIYAKCEDDLILKDFIDIEQNSLTFDRESINISEHINSKCMFCELFYLCHGCKHNRRLNKLIENHCQEMLKLKNRILEMNWKLQP